MLGIKQLCSCGSGISGEVLTEAGHRWMGIDVSEAMLQVAREREVEGELVQGDIGEGLPFEVALFDGAIRYTSNLFRSYQSLLLAQRIGNTVVVQRRGARAQSGAAHVQVLFDALRLLGKRFSLYLISFFSTETRHASCAAVLPRERQAGEFSRFSCQYMPLVRTGGDSDEASDARRLHGRRLGRLSGIDTREKDLPGAFHRRSDATDATGA